MLCKTYRAIRVGAAVLALGLMLQAASALAASGKYIIAGSNVFNGSDKGMIIGLDNSGLSATSFLATPFGPKDASFPSFNPGTGDLLYGTSRANLTDKMGVVDLEAYIDGNAPTVDLYPWDPGLGNIDFFDSEFEPDPVSGKFVGAMRPFPGLSGKHRIVTFDPSNGGIYFGAYHTMDIPETTWIYDGYVYAMEESNNKVERVLLNNDGTTTNNIFTTPLYALDQNGIPGSQGSYSEWQSATTMSDGTTLYGNYSANLYLFDIDTQPGAVVTNIDLLSHLTTSGGGFTTTAAAVSGIEHDESTGLFYVIGTLYDSNQGNIGSDFLVAVDKSGNVTPILQEINGDTLLPIGDAFGLAFAEFNAVPEPSSLVLAALGFVSLGWFGGRRRSRKSS